jgi:hypothetical protein
VFGRVSKGMDVVQVSLLKTWLFLSEALKWWVLRYPAKPSLDLDFISCSVFPWIVQPEVSWLCAMDWRPSAEVWNEIPCSPELKLSLWTSLGSCRQLRRWKQTRMTSLTRMWRFWMLLWQGHSCDWLM